jgi:hypothetical protein
MIAAAPEGSPPRQISDKQFKKTPAPPCLGEALRRNIHYDFHDSGVNPPDSLFLQGQKIKSVLKKSEYFINKAGDNYL